MNRTFPACFALATVVALTAALTAATAIADEDAGNLRARVAAAVERLGAESFQVRRTAADELLQLGPAILPLLPEPAALDDVSAREAVRGIRTTLERQLALDSARAARVSAKGTYPLSRILDEFERQTGNSLDRAAIPAELLEREITIAFENAAFWQALGNVAEQCGLRIAGAIGGRSVPLVPGNGDAAPLAIDDDGPYRLTVESAAIRPLFGDEERHLLRVRIGVLAEPRMRPLFLSFATSDLSVRTADGTQLAPFAPEAKFELPLAEGGTRLSFTTDFIVPAQAPPESVAISGKVTIQTAAGREAVRFPPLSEASRVSRRRGGATVALGQIAFHQNQRGETFGATLPVTVAYDAGGPVFESHRQWVYHNEVHLETRDGGRVERSAPFRVAGEADGGAMLEYTFPDLRGSPADYRFVYVLPTLFIDVPVKFSFSGVAVTRD